MIPNNIKSYKPKYYDIINDLKKEILCGRLKVGDPIPSENTLAKKYDMSRSTVRKALAQLVAEELIFTLHGKGYFVNMPDFSRFKVKLDSDEACLIPKTIRIEIIKVTEALQSQMLFLKTNKVLEICRTLSIDEVPVGFSIKYIPYNMNEPSLEREFHYLSFDHQPFEDVEKTIRFRVIPADADISKHLSINQGLPLFYIENRIENKKRETLSFEKCYINGEKHVIYGY